MSSVNVKTNKLSVTNLLNYFTNAITLCKNKKRQQEEIKLEQLLLEKRKTGLSEDERLSPDDSRCIHRYVEKANLLSYGIGIGNDGNQWIVVEQQVTYIDGTTKLFKISTDVTEILIEEISEDVTKSKIKTPVNY